MSLFVYLKEKLPILDVITDFVQVKPAGHYWKGPCPFHAEKDASFTVSPDKQIFYCFGCHASGDVVSFIARVENLTQREAAQYLVDRYKISVPNHLAQTNQASQQEKDEKERYYLLCAAVSAWAHKNLLANKAAIKYLKERQLSEQSIKTFQLGYFPSGTTAMNIFMKDLSKENFLLKDLQEHALVMEGRASLYSPFEERILFPIKDSMGRNCGFGGRIFKPGDERPKYYNSKESDGFEKGKILFGFDMAKKPLHAAGIGYLVEGYMDCIMMHQAGYQNTVATLGTACTLEHLKMLARYTHTLFVLYDGDQAGQKAMLRLTELCWEVNLELKIVTLPAGQDPASFLSQGGDLQDLVIHATDIVTFFINATGSNFTNKPLSQKLAVAEKITTIIAKIPHQFKRDLLLHHTASITQLPFSSLKDLLQRQSKTPVALPPEAMADQPEKGDFTESDEVLLLEEKIFSAILNGLQASMNIRVPDDIRPYFSAHAQGVLQKLDTYLANESAQMLLAPFLDTLDETTKAWAIRISMQHDAQSCQQGIDHLFARFYKHYWQSIVKDVKAQVIKAKQEHDNQKVQEVLERFAQLKQGILQNRGLLR